MQRHTGTIIRPGAVIALFSPVTGDAPEPGNPTPAVTATPPPVSELPQTGETPFYRDWLMLLVVVAGSMLVATAGLVTRERMNN